MERDGKIWEDKLEEIAEEEWVEVLGGWLGGTVMFGLHGEDGGWWISDSMVTYEAVVAVKKKGVRMVGEWVDT